MSRCLLCCLLLASASAVHAQDKEEPAAPADLVADSRVRLVRDLGGHTAVPRCLTFTPDGKKLISTGEDRTVQVWDVASKERLRVIRPPVGLDGQGGVVWIGMGQNPLAVDRKGERVAFCVAVKDDKGNVVRSTFVCSLETGQAQVLKHFGAHEFSPDGMSLAVAEEHNVNLVKIDTGEVLQTVKVASKGNVVNLAISPDGKTLAAVAGDDKVYLFNAGTLKLTKTLTVPGKGPTIHSVGWADDSTVACRSSTRENTSIVVLDAVKGGLKNSYSFKDLLSHFPPEQKAHLEALEPGKHLIETLDNVVAGTTKVLFRIQYSGPGGNHSNASFLLDWATGDAGKVFTQVSRFGCAATAIAPDLSIGAQGDGNQNDIFLWDPKEGKAIPDGKDVRRLRASSRGARGDMGVIRWRIDGDAFAWEQMPEGPGMRIGTREMDVPALTVGGGKGVSLAKYGKDNAALVLKDRPNDAGKGIADYERGIRRQFGPLDIKIVEHGLEVVVVDGTKKVVDGTKKVVMKGPWSPCQWDLTFVSAGDRVVYHPWRSNLTEVYDATTGQLLHSKRPVQSYIISWAVSPKPERPYLLIGSADQTLTVFNTATGKTLLTVYPTGGDWIAYTPEGYYAASVGGERLMGWHVDNGPDKLASFYPADRFRKQMYRPDVIKLVLEKGSVEEALKAANAALPKEQRPATDAVADVAQMVPPRATLNLLDKDDKTGVVKLSTDVIADAGGQGVKSMRIMIDGRPIPGDDFVKKFDTPQAKVAHKWPDLELPPGKHRVVILVKTEDASSLSNEKEIDTRPVTERPVLHVITVGVSKYKDKDLNLHCADADAKLLAKTFETACKGDLFGDVRPPTVLLNENATRDAVLDAVKKLRKTVKQNDLVVVFFAGHGAKENEQFYLLTHEAQVDNLAKTALNGRDMRNELKEVPCQVLFIMDACHSAGFGEKGKLTKNNLKPATDDATRTFTDDEVGVAVLCAAMGTEEASERGPNGLFTLALVKALTDKDATCNRANKKQYVLHLSADVFDWVVDESKEKQHPFLHLPWVVPSFPVRVVAPK